MSTVVSGPLSSQLIVANDLEKAKLTLRPIAGILDLDTPWFWFNTSWSTAAVAYGLTMCSAKGLPANKPHVLAMGQLAADGTNKYLDFDWAEASTAPSLANETRVLWE